MKLTLVTMTKMPQQVLDGLLRHFGTNIYVPIRMNCSYFGDLLTIHFTDIHGTQQ